MVNNDKLTEFQREVAKDIARLSSEVKRLSAENDKRAAELIVLRRIVEERPRP